MIAVIFELLPKREGKDRYFELAASLTTELENIDGFISIERFQSLAVPGKYLSLSYWRDEEAVMQWRNMGGHRLAQKEGRESVLAHYSLKVAEVTRSYTEQERVSVPEDSKEFHKS